MIDYSTGQITNRKVGEVSISKIVNNSTQATMLNTSENKLLAPLFYNHST